MRQLFTPIVLTDPVLQFVGREFTGRFHDGPFPMQPAGLNGIEPGTLGGQGADEEPEAPRAFRVAIVRPNPGPDGRAGMPRGVVPDQYPGRLAFCVQAGTGPGQELRREGRDGAVLDKAQPAPLRIGPHHAVAGHRFGLRVLRGGGPFEQAQGLLRAPGVHGGLRQARPPDFIHIPDHPSGLRLRPANQSIPPLFFRWYAGSGLVIQSRARRHFTPRRRSAWRRVSSLMRRVVRPCAKHASAAKFKVQVERGWPKVRGERCSRARISSRLAASSSAWTCVGRDERRCRQATPRAAKARRTLRTVWSLQPTWAAIWGARCPAPLANRIWLRRNVNASRLRKPAWTARASTREKGRIVIGGRIPTVLQLAPFSKRGGLALH